MVGVLFLLAATCVGALSALALRALVLRRRLARDPAVFPCNVRVVRGFVRGLPRRPRGHASRAQWVHDVLVLHRGRVVGWAQPLAVRTAEDVIEPAGPGVRLGLGAVRLQLRLDDDSVVAVAVPACASELLAGPFLAIAAHDLPPGVAGRQGP